MEQQLPLYHLFLLLRNEGFSLGTEQYLLLIRALHHKKYLLDLGIIRRTCQTLWANSQAEVWIFNRHFDLLIFSEKEVLKELEQAEQEAAKEKKEQEAKSKKTEEKKKAEETPPIDTDSSSTDSTSIDSKVDPKLSSPATKATLPGQFTPFQDAKLQQILMQGAVSPITLRQMQQSWRYLRRWKREGPRTEIDIEQTFLETAQKGFFTEPSRIARRVNRIELLLLIDRNGSMLPFHGLLDELIHTALHGGRFTKARCLYFHDYPIKYFYKHPQLVEEITLTQLKQQLHPKRTVALVISDAGAARRTFSEKRVQRTKKLQLYLKENTAAYAWLNPLPKERWVGCSAEDIQDHFSMFEVSQEGLSKAIDVLRGKRG